MTSSFNGAKADCLFYHWHPAGTIVRPHLLRQPNSVRPNASSRQYLIIRSVLLGTGLIPRKEIVLEKPELYHLG